MCVRIIDKYTVGSGFTAGHRRILLFSHWHWYGWNHFVVPEPMGTAMGKIIVKKRHTIRKSQMAALLDVLEQQIGPSSGLFSGGQIEIVETTSPLEVYLVDKKPLLFSGEGWVFPTLKGALERPFPERRVTVDAGAVKFVVNGADIMRPGITAVTDDVKAGSPVQVVDERHGKALAIGIALLDAADIRAATAGKMVKHLHFVGDDIWNLEL